MEAIYVLQGSDTNFLQEEEEEEASIRPVSVDEIHEPNVPPLAFSYGGLQRRLWYQGVTFRR